MCLLFLSRKTHVAHIEGMDLKLKRLRSKTLCLLFRRKGSRPVHNQPHKYTHTCSHNELPHQLFSTSQFMICNLRFLLPAAAGLFSTSKQELCCFPSPPPPPHQNLLNKVSCCLLAFCLEINKGQED